MAVLTDERGHIGASVISLERRLATMAGELAMVDGGAEPVERDRTAALLAGLPRSHLVAGRERRHPSPLR